MYQTCTKTLSRQEPNGGSRDSYLVGVACHSIVKVSRIGIRKE